MGAVLAMRRAIHVAGMMTAFGLMLAGCGQIALPGQGGETADPRTGLTRAALEARGQPRLYASVPGMGTAALLGLSGRNGDVLTWRTPDNVALSFAEGVLTATRGLGPDLMTAETQGTRALLAGRAAADGHVLRHSYLDGEHRPQIRAYQCRSAGRESETITIVGTRHAVTRVAETCRADGTQFTNVYWRGADGVIWKSRQWIGPDIGYLRTERLFR
jgi:hypothetical protein